MNILSLFVLIPALMLLGLWIARNLNQVRGVMVAGSSMLLALSIWLCYYFVTERNAGNDAEMLLVASTPWFKPLNIAYSVGVDGISVVMLLLSSIIVFTGTFASWQLKPMTKEYFLWFTLLSTGVYGFFICTDMFTMFMFYEVALIPMYLLIGVWGSGRKEYSAMKLTLMLMGGSALLILGVLGIYYFSGHTTMNVNEIAAMHNIPEEVQNAFFPFIFIGFGVLGALFPFHTWSPDGHASAPTAVSMLHAGVLMKLGGYGCFRLAMYLRRSTEPVLDLPDPHHHLGGLWCPERLRADRPEVHQRLFVGVTLRTGALRSAHDAEDRLHGCYPSDALTRFDDRPLLRPHRYDLWTYPHPRHPRVGRPDEDYAFPGCGLCHCRFCQPGSARFLRLHCRDDHLRWLV